MKIYFERVTPNWN